MLIPAVGCSDRQKRFWKPRSASINYQQALEATNPDDRRDAVTRIAESGYVASKDAFGVLDAVARTDPESQIRCIAIRAFARYGDDRPAGVLLAVLQATPDHKQEALPPAEDVRLEAATSLAELDRKQLVPDADQPTAMGIFLKLAIPAAPRDVRLVALRALGRFKDRQVFEPLVRALHESDFAFADTAERSLIALTGKTFDYNPDEWERWLASTQDPFAHAGEKAVSTRPAPPGWWEQERARWRRAFKERN